MSVTRDSTKFRSISLCANIICENKDDVQDELDRLNSIERPQRLGNQIIDIDSDDIGQSVLMFAENIPRGVPDPDDDFNAVVIDVDDDEDIHIHAEGGADLIEEYQRVFFDAFRTEREVKINNVDFEIEVDVPLRDLALPINWDSEYEIKGMQILHDSESYIISEHAEREDATNVSHSTVGGMDDELYTGEDFVEKKMDKVGQFIASLRT